MNYVSDGVNESDGSDNFTTLGTIDPLIEASRAFNLISANT